MRRCALVVLIVACSSSPYLPELADKANAIADAAQPKLDALVARIDRLKVNLRGNLPGWETMLPIVGVATEQLGLPPFVQVAPPGPDWRPSPASLLGIRQVVREQSAALVKAGDRKGLEFLVADEQRRLDQGIADVDHKITEVEQKLATLKHP